MQALILAAGMGKRLGKYTENNTKCMVKVNGVSLIERMLRQLSNLKLSRVVIVVGYKGDELKKYISSLNIPLNIVYVSNDIYDKTNNIYSFYLTKDFLLEEDTLLLESDLIFEDSILKKICDNPFPNLALVSKYESWMDGTMVRIDSENNIAAFVPKNIFSYQEISSYYKTVNIYKFSKSFIKNFYLPFLEAYIKAVGTNEYYEQILRVITGLDKIEFKSLPLDGEKWYEIDDIQDLDIAEAMFANEQEKPEKFFKRFGGYWRFPKLKDFCYLVNPYFPPQKMREELRSSFDTLLESYPSGMGINSMLAGKYFGLKADKICVGNGAAELIKAFAENTTGKVGLALPSFEEYFNRFDKNSVVTFAPQNDNFSYTARDLMLFFDDKEISTMLVVNPDNPSGNFIPKSDLLKLIDWAKRKSIRLVIDESFVDFADGDVNTLLVDEILESYTNLYVIKSISKSYGVPGLRLGIIASADTNYISLIKKNVAIWNINSFGEYYMQIFNKYEKDYKKACTEFKEERTRFKNELEKIKAIRVIPSQANYFLLEVDGIKSEDLVCLLLNKYNILLKDCSTKKGFGGRNFIRIAIRDKFDNDNLVSALKEVLG